LKKNEVAVQKGSKKMPGSLKTIWRNSYGWLLSSLVFILLPASMVSIVGNWHPLGFASLSLTKDVAAMPRVNVLDLVIYGVWTIVPPAWFLVEYSLLFPKERKLDPNQTADLKYTQELAGKFWAGVLLILGALLFLKYGQKLG
jgi:hypothetical protein